MLQFIFEAVVNLFFPLSVGLLQFLMNLSMLLFLSFFILLSSLSESFEFLVHNEESLLILCFIAFIFFAYSFVSVDFFNDFQKKIVALENQLLLVVDARYRNLLTAFDRFLFHKGLVIRLQFAYTLFCFSFISGWSLNRGFSHHLISSLFFNRLNSLKRLKKQTLKPIQSRLNYFCLVPLLFSRSSVALPRIDNALLGLVEAGHRLSVVKSFFRKLSFLKTIS